MQVKNIMRKEVITAEPEISIQEAVRTMVDNRVGSLIVATNNIVKGIITESDVIRAVAEGKDMQKESISNIMTPYVYTVSPNQKLEVAIATMKKHKVKKLPVMEGRKLEGIITTTDIIMSHPEMVAELNPLSERSTRMH